MRPRVFVSTLAVAALSAIPQARAQSAYDYPWCAVYGDNSGPGGGQACYYATYAQCMVTMSGIGGSCVRSPYYRGAPPRIERRHRN